MCRCASLRRLHVEAAVTPGQTPLPEPTTAVRFGHVVAVEPLLCRKEGHGGYSAAIANLPRRPAQKYRASPPHWTHCPVFSETDITSSMIAAAFGATTPAKIPALEIGQSRRIQ